MRRRKPLPAPLTGLLVLLAALVFFTAPLSAHGNEEHRDAAQDTAAAKSPPSAELDNASGEEVAPTERNAHSAARDGRPGFATLLRNLHPATVHFAIALFIGAAIAELILFARPTSDLQSAIRVMVYGGAAGAVIAALFGWIHTGIWFGGDWQMQFHRWNGTLLAIIGVVIAFVASRKPDRRIALRSLLFLVAIAVLFQGYLGAEIAHGHNHLWA